MKRISRFSHIFLIFVIIYWQWKLTYSFFPRIEFIDWISKGNTPNYAKNTREFFFQIFQITYNNQTIWNSRNISWIFETSIGKLCGFSIECSNTLVFAPFAGYLIMFYLFIQFLFRRKLVSTVAVLILGFSQPSFATLIWQATALDRLSSFFTITSLFILFKYISKSQFKSYKAVFFSMLYLLINLLAVVSKESAWILLPMLVAFSIMKLYKQDDNRLKIIFFLSPSIVFMIFHITNNVLKSLNDPHVASGDFIINFKILSNYLFHYDFAYALILIIGVYSAVQIYLKLRHSKGDKSVSDNLIFTLTIFVGYIFSWVLPIKTQYPNPFYLLLPTSITLILILFAMKYLNVNNFKLIIDLFCCFLLFSVLVTGFAYYNVHFTNIVALDRNFSDSKEDFIEVRKANPDKQVEFLVNRENFYGYQFVSTSKASYLWRFLGYRNGIDNKYASKISSFTCDSKPSSILLLKISDSMNYDGFC